MRRRNDTRKVRPGRLVRVRLADVPLERRLGAVDHMRQHDYVVLLDGTKAEVACSPSELLEAAVIARVPGDAAAWISAEAARAADVEV